MLINICDAPLPITCSTAYVIRSNWEYPLALTISPIPHLAPTLKIRCRFHVSDILCTHMHSHFLLIIIIERLLARFRFFYIYSVTS